MNETESPLPDDYAGLLAEVRERIRSAQYAALRAVNTELVGLYWDIERMIVERQEAEGWGKSVVEQLAADLRVEFPGMAGFSRRNVFYMREFYLRYRDLPKVQPLVAQIGWTHNLLILQRCKDALEREFYIRMTRKFGWTKNVLIHQIENQSYEKSLLGQTNFDRTLTPELRAHARLAVRDEYTFDFLELGDEHGERELERAIIARVEDFLRTLGGLFAFVGSQFRLEVDGDEYFIDLLLSGRARPPGPRGKRKPGHRDHSLQGKEPDRRRICPARRPQAHRRGNLPRHQTAPEGTRRPIALARRNRPTPGSRGHVRLSQRGPSAGTSNGEWTLSIRYC